MLIDAQNSFSWEDAVTADAISENVIDLLSGAIKGLTANTIRDIGAGKQLYLHAVVHTALASSGETTSLIATLESDDAADLAGSATVHLTSAEIEEADLVAGAWIFKGVPLPPGDYQRYLGMRYAVGAEEDFTSGKISAWISENRYDDRTYESAWSTGVN
jgi:hypothetical protein